MSSWDEGKEAGKHSYLGQGGDGGLFRTKMGDCEKGGWRWGQDPIWNIRLRSQSFILKAIRIYRRVLSSSSRAQKCL